MSRSPLGHVSPPGPDTWPLPVSHVALSCCLVLVTRGIFLLVHMSLPYSAICRLLLVTRGLLVCVHVFLSFLATCLLRVLTHGVFQLARVPLYRLATCRIVVATCVIFLTGSMPFPGFATCHILVAPRARHDLYHVRFLLDHGPFLVLPHVSFGPPRVRNLDVTHVH